MTSNLFHQVPDAHVILSSKGVWRQAGVFVFQDVLFAKYGSGFVGLRMFNNQGGTTLPNLHWVHLEGVEYDLDRGTGKLKAKGI